MDKKTKYLMTMISGLLLVGLGMFFSAVGKMSNSIVLSFVNGGVILLVIAVFKFNKYGAGVSQDEMTRKMSSKAISYSWLFTFVLMNILYWLSHLGVVELTLEQGIGALMFPMLLSAAVLKWLFKSRGMVDED